MKNNSYNLNKDVLTIRTTFGHYSFKIESSELLDDAERIVKLMISELDNVDNKLNLRKEKSGQYARLLLTNLNLCEKYIRLEDKYKTLTDKLENIYRKLESATASSIHEQHSSSSIDDPKDDPPSANLVSIIEENKTEEPTFLSTEEVGVQKEHEKLNIENIQTTSEEQLSESLSSNEPILPEEQPSDAVQSTIEQKDSNNSDEPLPNNIKPKRPEIINWKLSESYLALKRKAMEKMMQLKAQHKTIESDNITKTSTSISSTSISSTPISSNSSIPVLDYISDSKPTELPIISAPAESQIPESLPAPTIYDSDYTPIEQTDTLQTLRQVIPVEFLEVHASLNQRLNFGEPNNINNQQEKSLLSESHTFINQQEKSLLSGESNTFINQQEKSLLSESNTFINQQEKSLLSGESNTFINQQNNNQYVSKPTISKPKLYRKGEFQLPNLSFLKNTSTKTAVDHHSIRRDAELLEKKLGYFGIKGEVMGVSPGPVITTFEYRPEPGIKISKIVNLADDLALALSAFSIRIVAPIPGKDVMGIEIPNIKKSLVPFIDIVSSENFINSKSKLPICLGKDIVGNPVVVELDRMPHLLIAGATGTGKSVGLNAMITSVLYKSTPEEVKFLMVDPKRIELSFYNDIPHLLTPVITDMKKATIALQWLVREMDRRYTLLAKTQVRHIEQYNQKIKNMISQSNALASSSTFNDNYSLASKDNQSESEEPEQLPYIVVIIDELADLMMTASRDIEFSLTRLAQMARAAGIHLILATQRPSVDVLTGIIKANFPTRISFQVSSKTDSRTIIDANGAETLLGNGDMLFVPPGSARLTRVHGTYLSEDELMAITTFLKSQGKPEYVLDVITETDEEPPQDTMDDDYDDKYNEALEFVITTKQASISGIQRALRVGYNRAARIIDIMEKRGIVGPSDGVKPRRVIVENIEY